MTPAPNAAPTETRLRLEVAATELHRAAAHADLAGDGDPFSPWTALAGQIRLVAAGIAIVPEPPHSRKAARHRPSVVDWLDVECLADPGTPPRVMADT